MIEFWLTDNGDELFRQTLSDGLYQLGRANDNDLAIRSPHISRNHLQIDVNGSKLLVTDLGSTNGFTLNGRPMPPHRAFTVTADDELGIGPLRLYFQPQAKAKPPAPVSQYSNQAHSGLSTPGLGRGITVYCGQATPNKYDLRSGALTIGQGTQNSMRVSLPGVAEQQALVRLTGSQVEVLALTDNPPVSKNGIPIPVGTPTPWSANESLLIGQAGFIYTPLQATTGPTSLTRNDGGQRWLLTAGGVGLFAFIVLCLIGAGIFAVSRLGDEENPDNLIEGPNGPATPTLAPVGTNELAVTRADGEVFIVTVTPPPPVNNECETLTLTQNNGFLDLPFPYKGTDSIAGGSSEEFRRISQRTRFGGRINSFFDHEYPVYPPAFGGWEPAGIDLTMVLFDGSRSDDAFVQDAADGDWYSGHAGIDYAPVNPLIADTPILAAADGRIHLVTVYSDGNHAVWLTHDPDGDGTYQYATIYFHLDPDPFWQTLVGRYNSAVENGETLMVAQGERIGTMGTTGRSTGIHLHFEVRHDVNPPFGVYDRLEKVDPYGFFPGEIEVDPWSEEITWIDTKGEEREHTGIVSEYLWVHPLVEIEAEDADLCASDIRFAADIRGLIGWTVVDPGFTIAIRDDNGTIVAEGNPQTRRLTIRADELVGVSLDTVSLEYFDADFGIWVAAGGADGLMQRDNGDYSYTATVNRTGQYVLIAEQNFDFIPPTTRIQLEGSAISGTNNNFQGSVTVSMIATDEGLPVPSGIDTIQYSLDCGNNWLPYTGPFTITNADMGACGTGTSDQGIQLGENELLILAIASDTNGNIEQPASQVFVSVRP